MPSPKFADSSSNPASLFLYVKEPFKKIKVLFVFEESFYFSPQIPIVYSEKF